MKRRKKISVKKIFFLIIIFTIIYFIYNKSLDNKYISGTGGTNLESNIEYETIKLDNNEKYSGIGQQKVKNKDGYFTTFTIAGGNKRTFKEYKQNGNSSWSNKGYWGGTMEENGCGITAIATILSGYNKDYTPEDLREKYYPVLNSDSISTELYSTFGIKNSDFYYDDPHLSNSYIIEHLKTNRPILICVWNKPTINRWTTASHYMVLLATDNNEMVYVSNPNGLEDNSKSSGWYNINEVTKYIAKALYIESY